MKKKGRGGGRASALRNESKPAEASADRVTPRPEKVFQVARSVPRLLKILIAVVVLAYPNVIFFGDSLVGSANYPVFDDRFDHLGYEPMLQVPYMNWHDMGATWWQWEPAGHFFSKAYRSGELPLWDPTSAAGVNAHANLTQGQYFPPYALVLLLGNSPRVRDIYTLAMLLSSGWLSARLLRRNGFHEISSVAMAVVWMLGGSVTLSINSLLGQSYLVLPLGVLAADWFLDRPGLRRGGVFSLAIALCVLSSFMPGVLAGFFLIPFLAVAAFLSNGEERTIARRMRGVGGLFAAVALGIGATAFLLLPVSMAGDESLTFNSWYVGTGLHHYPLDRLFTLISPSISYDVWRVQNPGKHLLAGGPIGFFWVGLTPLLLATAAFGTASSRARRLLIFFCAGGAVVLLKLIGVPPFQWLAYLPVLEKIHFIPYFNGALSFAVAGMAGLGIERIVRRGVSRTQILVTGGVFVTIALSYVLFLYFKRMDLRPFTTTVVWELVRISAAGLALLLVLALRRRGLSGGAAGWALVGVMTFELLPLVLHDRLNRFDPWADPPRYVRFLQEKTSLARIHTNDGLALPANVPQGLGLNGLGSRHAFNPARIDRFLREYFDTAELHYPVVLSILPRHRPVLDLLNVRYVVAHTRDDAELAKLSAAGLAEVHLDGAFHVLENREVWPRAWLATDVLSVATPDEALKAVHKIDRTGELVLEGKAATRRTLAGGKTAILHYSPDEVAIGVDSRGEGWLFLADSFAPGWTATVNGRDAEVVPGNYAFRAVRVPSGKSTVRFQYRPSGLRAGLTITLACVALITIALLLSLRRAAVPPRVPA